MSDVINNLAKATAHWLEYKAAAGFGAANCEALLIVPIVECLAASMYSSKTEQKMSSENGGPDEYSSCDVEATKNNGESGIILETKYLTGNDKRLYIDLLKLASPTEQQRPKGKWHRLLLIAGKATYLANSEVVKRLKKTDTVIIKANGNYALQDNELDLEHEGKSNQELRKYWTRNEKLFPPNTSGRFAIKMGFEANADETRVVIFSVTRP